MKKLTKPLLVGMSLLAAAVTGACNKGVETIYGPPGSFDNSGDGEIEDIYGPPSAFDPSMEEEEPVTEEDDGSGTGESVSGQDGESVSADEAQMESVVELPEEMPELIYGPPESFEVTP